MQPIRSPPPTTIRTAPGALPDRRRADAAGRRRAYERIVLLFDGEDDEAVAAARTRWSEAKARGFDGHLLAGRRAGTLGQEGLTS